MKELISVIVPIYNSEKYIRGCIESVINQSYKNIELILVNDGSTDNSAKICNNYAKEDQRIRVINTTNHGPSSARNIGIEDSRGEFIFFIDSDDLLEENAFQLLMEQCDQHQADIVIGDFLKIKNGSFGSGHERYFSESKLLNKEGIVDYARQYLKKPNRFPLFAYSWGRLFKSSIIKNNKILFNGTQHTFEDVAFNFSYLNHAGTVFFLKAAVYKHLVHDNYVSATMSVGRHPRKMLGYKEALVNIGKYLENSNSDADTAREVGHAYVTLTIIQLVRTCGQINNGGNKTKIYEFVSDVVYDPATRKNLQFYAPTEGDSKVLPILMKLKLVWPIILVCMYKAHKRYKRRIPGK